MPETTEAQDIIATAQEAVEPHEVHHGIYLVRDRSGDVRHLDLTGELEQTQARPNRKHGRHAVTDVASLAGYLAKHGLPETELWGNPDPSSIKAVINAHEPSNTGEGDDANGLPGWGDHTITLDLKASKDWIEWIKSDGQMMNQTDFAEFIENHLPNFHTPAGADMLELAQTFQATTRVDFDTSQRLKSGETQVTYKEHTDATAGKKGSIAIPDTFTLGLQVYERGHAFRIEARFRYRINGGRLLLGYKLTRPRDVLLTAFDEVVEKVQEDTKRTVWLT